MADITPTATPPLSRGSSFQRMLDLEKRYRLERLYSDQGQPDISPTSPTERLSPPAPLQLRRANSLSQQQQDLMLKAVRRSIAPPPLSIDIPPPNSDRRFNEARPRHQAHEREPEPEPDLDNVESLQKSVKFLAPDSDEGEESDQSSICHSPSWEGYGQNKKKDKKKDAERKRKAKEQKEQAEREAKAAKKRSSSRLSKTSSLGVHHMPSVMERSNSAPVLSSHSFRGPNRSYQMPTVQDEEDNADFDLHQNPALRSVTPDPTEMLDIANSRFVGGLKLQQEREAALQYAIHSQFAHANGPDPRQRMHKSASTGPPVVTSAPVSGSSSVRNDSRSSREPCPPSASRTPMLRHNSAQQTPAKTSRGRDSNTHPAISSFSGDNHSPDSLLPDGSIKTRGRNDGYVRHYRDQSTERALAELTDGHHVSSNGSSSTRSSSQHTRRSSLSRDVKTAALRLTGQKVAPVKRSDPVEHEPVDQPDYFNYSSQPHSPSATQVLSPSAGVLAPARAVTVQPEPTSSKPIQGSVSSGASNSTTATKARSIKDVARAAFHLSPSQSQVPTFRPTVKPPPYYMLRAKFSSSSSVPKVGAPMPMATQRVQQTKPVASPSATDSSTAPHKPGSRVSEGSSSSSNYDDGSPLPSPATTPDTSRPQSLKGPPEESGAVPERQEEEDEEDVVQDDARTLRQTSGASSSGSSSDVTPRLTQYDEEGNEMLPDDRWSRTAMPMDIDFEDAQSTESDYADARENPLNTTPEQPKEDVAAQHDQRFGGPGEPFDRPHLSRSHSDPDLTGNLATRISSQKQQPALPLRSKVREEQEAERPKTASAGQLFGKQPGNARTKDLPRESDQRKKLRKQKPAQETKPDNGTDEDVEAIVRAADDSKLSAAQASANTSLMSARFMSPIGGFIPSYGFASNPLFVDFSEISKATSTTDQGPLPVKITATQITFQTQPQAAAPKAITDGVQGASKAPSPATEQQETPPPAPAKAAARTLSAPISIPGPKPAPPSRSTTTPVSILKPTVPQPTLSSGPAQGSPLPPVLSAIPKHLQPQSSARAQALVPPEARMAPIAKMFVECCSCKFYHDMPSKLYECMAKPDAVVEDKLRGISGAITTMVKCPWCQHNMSTSCCAGYAAVVYVKEKLH